MSKSYSKAYSATSAITSEIFTRTTTRAYTHCVVAHIKAQQADGNWMFRPARRVANWAGSLALAKKSAAGWTSSIVDRVEIIPAEAAS
jgi:hypothetical protein